MEKVRHPNVVQFVGAVTQNIPMMIVREYHAKVTLTSVSPAKGSCFLFLVGEGDEREPVLIRRSMRAGKF